MGGPIVRVSTTIIALACAHFSARAQAPAPPPNFVIPDLCVGQAAERKILKKVPPGESAKALAFGTGAVRDYDYDRMLGNFERTLAELNGELEKRQPGKESATFAYVYRCAKDPLHCGGFFQPADPAHLRLYCDREMLRGALEDGLTARNTWIRQCGVSRELFYRKPDEPGKTVGDDPRFQKDCIVLGSRNKAAVYEEENAAIQAQVGRMEKIFRAAYERSPMPDAFAYVLYRNITDFGLIQGREETYLRQQRYAAFLGALLDPAGIQDLQGRYLVSRQYATEVGESILSRGLLGDVFTPELKSTLDAFSEYENERLWQAQLQAPRYQAKIDRAAASRTRPFGPPPAVAHERAARRELLPVPVPNEDQEYRAALDGFLPYQFMRTLQARLIRRLEQLDVTMLARVLAGPATFSAWADLQVDCEVTRLDFCGPRLRGFRHRKYEEFRGRLVSGQIKLYARPAGERGHYVYGRTYVDRVLHGINAINEMCWKHAEPAIFARPREIEAFMAANAPILDGMLHDFYTIEGMDILMQNSEFLGLVGFDKRDRYAACFKDGYLFGPLPEYDPEYRFIKGLEYARAYPSMGPAPVMSKPQSFDSYTAMDPPRDKYQQPTVSFTVRDLNKVEDDVEETIREELGRVYRATKLHALDDVREFLRESAGARIFAMLDFGVEYPSAAIGKIIRDAILGGYGDERREEMVLMVGQLALAAATLAVSFFVPPAHLFLYTFTTGLFLTATGAGVAIYQEARYRHQLDLLDAAGVTGNFRADEGSNLHAHLMGKIRDQRVLSVICVALSVAGNLVFVARNVSLFKALLRGDLRKIYYDRITHLDKLRRTTEDNGWMTHEFRNYMANARNVSAELFEDFVREASLGRGREFVERVSQLFTRFPALGASAPPGLISQALGWYVGKVKAFVQFLLDQLFRVPYFGKVKYVWLKFIRYVAKNDYLAGVKLQDVLNHALERGQFTAQEIEEAIVGNTFGFHMVGGRVAWVGALQRMVDADEFLGRVVVAGANGNANVRSYLESLVKGNILDDREWTLLFQNFPEKIESIEDAKSFLRVVKFAKENSGLRRELLRIPSQGFNSQQQITDALLVKSGRLFQVAKYVQGKNFIRFHSFCDDFIRANPGYSWDEVADIVGALHTYDLRAIRANIGGLRSAVRAFQGTDDAFEKDFIHKEVQINDLFYKKLRRQLRLNRGWLSDPARKAEYFRESYRQALTRTQLRKMVESECSLPNSPLRAEKDQTFVALTKSINTTSNIYAYYTNHRKDYNTQQAVDFEWFSRLGYEIFIPRLSAQLKSEGFIKAKNIAAKWVYDNANSAMLNVSLSVPSFTLFNQLFWESPNLDMARLREEIYKAEDPEAKLDEIFARHPAVRAMFETRLKGIEEAWDEFYGNLDWAAVAKDPNGFSADGLYRAFIAKGLVDSPILQEREAVREAFIKEGLVDAAEEEVKDARTLTLDTLDDAFYHYAHAKKPDGFQWFFWEFDPISIPDAFDIKSRDYVLVPDFMSESVDRFLFFSAYNLGDAFVTTARQHAMRKALCELRYLPPVVGQGVALLIYAATKATTDPFNYYIRKQITGH